MAEISGTKWEDVNGDGVRNAGEPGLEGVAIYLDLNDDGVLDSGTRLEPDEFPHGTILNTALPEVTLSVANSSNNPVPGEITATSMFVGELVGPTTTGVQVFGNNGGKIWTGPERLRMDFSQPVQTVSLDFIAGNTIPGNNNIVGRLEVYAETGVLLEVYQTRPLDNNEAEQMVVSRPTADIAYAVAVPEPQGRLVPIPQKQGRFDNLVFGSPEPSTTTDVNGTYEFTHLAAGDYVVREVEPEGFQQTFPGAGTPRLFAILAGASSGVIVELDPVTGAELNRFDPPDDNFSITSGLAFDGRTLYALAATSNILYELDPDTGVVLDSLSLRSTRWDGVAVLNGEVYVNDPVDDEILVINPTTNEMARTINFGAGNNFAPFGALGEFTLADGSDVLLGTVGNSDIIAFLDPLTGESQGIFSTSFSGTERGLAGFNNEIYVGVENLTAAISRVEVYSQDGTLQRSFQFGGRIGALAAGSAPNGAHRVTVASNEVVDNLDFGNQDIRGQIRGTKFEDSNGDGVRDDSEPGLAGVTIYLDRNNNDTLDTLTTFEPDTFAVGTELSSIPGPITLTTLEVNGNPSTDRRVFALSESRAPTGTRVFGHGSSLWPTNRLLRIQFAETVSTVSVDFTSPVTNPSFASVGQLEVYNRQGVLLGTYTTQPVLNGQVETMTVSIPEADIAVAIARTQQALGIFDNLQFGHPERSITTDDNGDYWFTGLDKDDYMVREVVPTGFAQTTPQAQPVRLFGVREDLILELDPTDGTQLSQFPVPGPATSTHGLAFDGTTLFYTNAVDNLLRQIDPDTGAVLTSRQFLDLPQFSRLSGVAVIDGLVYLLNNNGRQFQDLILVYDPVAGSIVRTLNVTAENPGVDLADGFGESGGELVATTLRNEIFFLDPFTGKVTGSLVPALPGGADLTVTGIGEELFVSYTFGASDRGVGVYDRSGALLRNLDEVDYRVYGLGGSPSRTGGQQVTLDPGEVVNDLDFGNEDVRGEIHGTKWQDRNGNGIREEGEPPLEGVTIYLDLNNNGVLDTQNTLEPDDYAPNTFLTNVRTGVTLTAANNLNVTQQSPPILARTSSGGGAPTGDLVFGFGSLPYFDSARRLRMDFASPVALVSLDFAGLSSVESVGRLEVFDANDNLLETYRTGVLTGGTVETLAISRPTANIAYAIAFAEQGNTGARLDNLIFGTDEVSTVTDANGAYWFQNVLTGDYVVREVVPENFRQTSPLVEKPHRLFAALATPDDIVELDPATGEELNRFPAPTMTNNGRDGLAFDGQSLWFINGLGDDFLYELDPDTGAVTDADPITVGSGNYEGLATLNGKVYILDFGLSAIFEFDPQTDTITNQLNLPGVGGGGLAGITGPDRLVTRQANILVEVDPTTGEITSSFGVGTGLGLAVVDGEIHINAASNSPTIRVFSRSGQLLRQFNLSTGSAALGGDDVGGIEPAHLVSLEPAQILTGLDFGNQPNLAAIQGTKWDDFNGNGIRDEGEPGLEGVTIYLDLNDNDVLDNHEPSAVTDTDGQYQFRDLLPGDYVVREVIPDGYQQTSPSFRPARLFTVRPGTPGQILELNPNTGAILNEFPAPGTEVTFEQGLAFDGTTLYTLNSKDKILYELDPNDGTVLDSTPFPNSTFAGLATVDGLVYLLQAYSTSITVFDPATNAVVDTLTVTNTPQSRILSTGLGEVDGQLVATVLDSLFSIVLIDPQTGEVTTRFQHENRPNNLDQLAGVTGFDGEIYVGVFTTLPPSGETNILDIDVYSPQGQLLRRFQLDPASETGIYALAGARALTGAHRVSLQPGQVAEGLDFGNQSTLGEIRGTKWDDFNGNGVRDEGEPGLEGVTIYLDWNNNARLDNDEPVAVTDSEGHYTLVDVKPGAYAVREEIPTGYTQTFPTTPPATRLYGWVGGLNPEYVVEIDPEDGTFLKEIPVLLPRRQRDSGLAYDGKALYFNDNEFLYRVDPTPYPVPLQTLVAELPAGGQYVGLATVGGSVYVLDEEGDDILEVDPQTGQVIQILDIDGLNPGVNLANSLGESDGDLIASSGDDDTIYFINPTTGQITGSFGHGVFFASTVEIEDIGATGFNGQIYIGFKDLNYPVHVYHRSGELQRTLGNFGGSFGLAGVVTGPGGAHRVTLAPRQILEGVDFGNFLNRPPVPDAGGPYVTQEGQSVQLDASASTDLNEPTSSLTFEWDLDYDGTFDATPGVTGQTPTVSFDDNFAGRTIAVRVTDSSGVRTIATSTLEVLNVAPMIVELTSDATFDSRKSERETVTIEGTLTDPALGAPTETFTGLVHWGDGTTSPLTIDGDTFSATHTYVNGGIFDVRVTLEDDDLGQDEANTTAVITGAGINNGSLQIVGTDGRDRIHVLKFFGRYLVLGNSLPRFPVRIFPVAGVDRLEIFTFGEDDRVRVWSNVTVTAHIDGGTGDDALSGGSGNDHIFGGEGDDRMEGNSGDDRLWGGDGNDTLNGGLGSDALMGEAGEDRLWGGFGRNILIGGAGVDRVTGGRSDDILIGGTTAYDNNLAALDAILTEWNSDEPYLTRVDRLRTGQGPILNGVQLLAGTTVFDDDARDRLRGQRGTDWFVADLDEQDDDDDVLRDRRLAEIVDLLPEES